MIRKPRSKDWTERNSPRIYPFGEGIGKIKPLKDHTKLHPFVETIEEDHTPSREIQRAYEEYRKENPLSEQDWHHARHEIAFERYKRGIPLPDEEKPERQKRKIPKETIGERAATKHSAIEFPKQTSEFVGRLGKVDAKIAIFAHGKITVFIEGRGIEGNGEVTRLPRGEIEIKHNLPANFKSVFGMSPNEAILKAVELAVSREKQHQT